MCAVWEGVMITSLVLLAAVRFALFVVQGRFAQPPLRTLAGQAYWSLIAVLLASTAIYFGRCT